jgi:hypothetical protein
MGLLPVIGKESTGVNSWNIGNMGSYLGNLYIFIQEGTGGVGTFKSMLRL